MDSRLAQRHRGLVIGVVLSVLLLVGMAGPALSVAAQQDATNATDSDRSELPPHQNPAEISVEGDLRQLETLLRGSLDGQLSASIENLNQDDYEQAQALLGDSYGQNLSRYRELAAELDASEQAELYAAAQANQQEYIEAVESYETMQAEYEQARRDDNDERVRELARNLTAAANNVSRDGRRLSNTYQTISQETGQNYSQQVDSIQTQRIAANETRDSITETVLTETTLSVTATQSSVSFTDQLRITGQLQTAAGNPVESQQARIAIQNQRYTVDLADDGTFELTAAPDGVWNTVDQLQVRYLPDRSSAYLGAETNLSVSVETTETTITVQSASSRVSYDESLNVTGTVTATETTEAVPAVPVVLRVDGTRIETTETTTTGQFEFSGDLPATVSAGTSTISVALQPGPLAVEAADSQIDVTVEPTETVVSVNATVVQGASEKPPIQVRGSVESDGGRAVTGTPVTVRIDETAVGVVETDTNGQFIEQFAVPAETDLSEPIVVAAEFDQQGSSLLPAAGSTTVEPPQTVLQTIGRTYGPLGIGLSIVGGLGLLVTAGWLVRGRSTEPQPTTAEPTNSAGIDAAQRQELLTVAADQLEDGTAETAALLAYATVRRQLAPQVAVSETATHWEWYQACVAAGVDHLSELETLVEAFEQVTFAPDSDESVAAASRAVSTANQVVNSDN
jgi:hypothetical protein